MSRSDIEKYGEQDSGVSKNSIEQKEMSDSFDQDAMEGWKEASYDTSVLHTMKSKLFIQSSFPWMTAIGSLLVGGILVLGYQAFLPENNETVNPKIAQKNDSNIPIIPVEINIESTDVIIPVEIEQMLEIAKEEQIIPEAIIEDFVHMEEFEIKFPALVPIIIPVISIESLAPVIDKFNAKEIYLNDLKLIDYREYRTDPVIETKQLILTGTPADREDESSESFESDWKDVQRPYLQYLDKSIYYFNKRKSKKALARFETIIQAYPLDVNANFYGGLCLYNFGEYEEAIKRFETCLSTKYRNFDDEAIWMKALCLEQLNKQVEAKNIFLLISESKGFYSNQAKEKLK